MEKLIDAIKQGVRNAYFENKALKTSYKSLDGHIVEYLITVNIAQSLYKWKEEQGHFHSISLEFDVEEFIKNSFPDRVEIIDLWNTILTNPSPSTLKHNDSGRLDIAIFQNENESFCPIEVKAINQNYDLIVEDVERVCKIISKSDLNGIENTAKVGFCVFLKHIGGANRVSHENGLNSTSSRIVSEFEDKIQHFKSDYNCKLTTEDFEIEKINSNNLVAHPKIEDYQTAASETGSIFGVLVKIERI